MAAPRISFEFFPPRTAEQKLILESTWQKLAPLNPDYLSVTFGAGGSTLEATRETVEALAADRCAGGAAYFLHGPEREMLHESWKPIAKGVKRLVVLRGDRPEGVTGPGPFQYANELVSFIRQEFGDHFHIEVACYPEFHPESSSPRSELYYFKQKVDAGANGAVTQYFYNADSYFRFVDDCRRTEIDIPITPGIMPITNYRQLSRFSDMCGAEIPQWIRRRLEGYGDDGASIRAFGLDVVTACASAYWRAGRPGCIFTRLTGPMPASCSGSACRASRFPAERVSLLRKAGSMVAPRNILKPSRIFQQRPGLGCLYRDVFDLVPGFLGFREFDVENSLIEPGCNFAFIYFYADRQRTAE